MRLLGCCLAAKSYLRLYYAMRFFSMTISWVCLRVYTIGRNLL